MERNPTASYDVIILGSGGAALAAAVTAAHAGLSVLILERDSLIGGTSAMSGGAVWIPGSRQALAAGMTKTVENARTYLKNLLGNHYNAEIIETFFSRGPEALAFLEDNSELRYSLRALSPDYYPEVEGATDNGGPLEVLPFDGKRLGPYFNLLRAPTKGMMLFGGLMISRPDIYHLLRMKKSLPSLWYTVKLMLRFGRDRLTYPRGTRLVIGNAMTAQLLKTALDKGVKFQIEAQTKDFLFDQGRVNGVSVQLPGGRMVRLSARHGVILATGGISRKPHVLAERPNTHEDHLTMAAPKSDGSMIALAEKYGAETGHDMVNHFYWAPMSEITHKDGSLEIFPHIVTDRAKPGVIAVNEKGQRFCNEANCYHRFVMAMREQQALGHTRFYLIADAKAVKTYGLGLARPSPGNNAWLVQNGYLIECQSLAALAGRIGVDAKALAATIALHNRDAIAGDDTKFHKGINSYNRSMGDADAPHPNLAPVEAAPFYAVRIHTGDLGSARGLVTDTHARVRKTDGTVIPGLYAAGNDMNSPWAGEYPAAGATLGPGLTFGYVAAKAIAEEVRAN